jgi:hypothetical protein
MAKNKNSTRQTIEKELHDSNFGIQSGFEGEPSNEFYIPPCGIEDADVSLFNLFDRDIGFTDKTVMAANQNMAIKKPFVIFATGERFAVAKKLRPPRDKQGQLMLPAISIRRTSFSQTNEDITGRGMNQFTGNIVIKRKLDENSDKDYQNFINKYALKNLDLPLSNRITGQEKSSEEVKEGSLLAPSLRNNFWEVITIPQPQFFTTTYEVIFWTNYTQHMNYLIETYVSSFLPQSRGHKLITDKGYWFLSYTDDSFNNSENFDDFTDDSRVMRYTFSITVKGYILATNHETNKVPIRREVISPVVVFDSLPSDNLFPEETFTKQKNLENGNFVLSEISEDPSTAQQKTTNQKFIKERKVFDPVKNKFVTKRAKILEKNQKSGETVYYSEGNQDLDDFIKTLNS